MRQSENNVIVYSEIMIIKISLGLPVMILAEMFIVYAEIYEVMIVNTIPMFWKQRSCLIFQ